jgi:hypothetical protein
MNIFFPKKSEILTNFPPEKREYAMDYVFFISHLCENMAPTIMAAFHP